jgi:hypothetical protein
MKDTNYWTDGAACASTRAYNAAEVKLPLCIRAPGWGGGGCITDEREERTRYRIQEDEGGCCRRASMKLFTGPLSRRGYRGEGFKEQRGLDSRYRIKRV